MRRNPILSLLVFVAILVAINVVARFAGWEFRVSIIGSILLTVVLSAVLSLFNRRRR